MRDEVTFKTAFFSVESVVLDHYTVINKNKYYDLKGLLKISI